MIVAWAVQEDQGRGVLSGAAAASNVLCQSCCVPQAIQGPNKKPVSWLQPQVGTVTIAFCNVVNAAVLLTELPQPARQAISLFQSTCVGLLTKHDGYAVEVRAGPAGMGHAWASRICLAGMGRGLGRVHVDPSHACLRVPPCA